MCEIMKLRANVMLIDAKLNNILILDEKGHFHLNVRSENNKQVCFSANK